MLSRRYYLIGDPTRESVVAQMVGCWAFPDAPPELPYSLMIGHETAHRPSYQVRSNGLPAYAIGIIAYTLSGQGALVYDGQRFAMTPGRAMLLYSGDNYSYYLPPGGEPWEQIYFLASGGDFVAHLRACIAEAGPVVELSRASLLVAALERTVQELAHTELLDCETAAGYAYDIAMILHRTLKRERTDLPLPIYAAIEHVALHYHEPLSVEALATVAGLSRAHFSRLFHRVMGLSPVEYILQQRLRYACAMLRHTTQPIQAVSQLCGFNEPTYFYNRFKRVVGCTPAAYRIRQCRPAVEHECNSINL